MSDLASLPVARLRGAGPAVAERLARLGIRSVADLLFHLPRQYEDRTQLTPLGALMPGMTALAEGEVRLADIANGRRRALLVRLRDGTGSLTLRFYHFRNAQKDSYTPGLRLRVFGEVRSGPNGPEMIHPEIERIPEEGLAPAPGGGALTAVYPLVEGLTQRRLRELTTRALALLDHPQALPDLLPPARSGGWRLADALRLVHAPPADADRRLLARGEHPAQQRLVFEELVAHQLGLLQRRALQQRLPAPVAPSPDALTFAFLAALPFSLTEGQQQVLSELRADLARPVPMMRLVQGDVGAGKTVVAALAACPVLAAGLQVVIMAPTEILAAQHRDRFASWFEPLGIRVGWLSGKLTGKPRQQLLARLADGDCQLLVGTHAVFQDPVQFRALGLVVIDEQHRFGVAQRLALTRKGEVDGRQPHQLVMTATPIPRTLAMSAYGDLDTSVIRGLPPGRQPIQTVVLPAGRRDDLIARLAHHAASGQQAYWVCTLIEDNEEIEAQAAETTQAELVAALPALRIGLVHGRMKAPEKAAVMQAFAAGEIQVLVATTVIEVGVDVPNASLMVIENAERLGLSQLHQLRGRVGRGTAASYCVLLYGNPLSQMGRERLQTLRDSQDGFEIAEKDLALRGPGEVLGTRQTGEVSFRLADLLRDQALLEPARQLAASLLAQDAQLSGLLLARWLPHHAEFARV